MNVAIIFIGTNKYLNFLPSWHESCEKYLFANVEKQYFVFTDGELNSPPENINFYFQEHLSWPYVTLLRFNTILKAKEELENFDWIIFLDADMLIVKEIKAEEFFTEKPYIGVHHPCHFMNMNPHNKFPGAFETNKNSTACISEGDDTSVYFQGCLWGGKVLQIIEMMEELDKRIQKDLKNDVIAIWHDESHMNKFFAERRNDIHVLPPSYAYPEIFSQSCNFEPKIIHLAKNNSEYQQ